MLPARLVEPLNSHMARVRALQELLRHKDVFTTMIYTHVLNRGGRGVLSPFDRIDTGPN